MCTYILTGNECQQRNTNYVQRSKVHSWETAGMGSIWMLIKLSGQERDVKRKGENSGSQIMQNLVGHIRI